MQLVSVCLDPTVLTSSLALLAACQAPGAWPALGCCHDACQVMCIHVICCTVLVNAVGCILKYVNPPEGLTQVMGVEADFIG